MGTIKQDGSLKRYFEQQIAIAAEAIHAFPWQDKRAYGGWLAQTYYLVQHTTRFLALTAGKYGVDDDEAHKGTLQHLREESGHDALALRDLKTLGFALTDFPELTETAVIYQSQYYWIERTTPIAHLGYALMLEGLAAQEGNRVVDTVAGLHGPKAANFLRTHTVDDVDHFAHGLANIASTSAAKQALVRTNLAQSVHLYRQMLKAIELAFAAGGSNLSRVA